MVGTILINSNEIITLLIAIIILAGCGLYACYHWMRLSRFIKENKLEKKFQEYKKDNKGL